MKRFAFILAGLCLSGTVATADPVGESSSFTLNKSRSHGFIKSGEVVHSVTRELGETYETSMYCNFDVRFIGRKEGTGTMPFAKEAFDPQWLESLRAGNEYVGPGHTVNHIGYGDARSTSGTVYENCDKIHITEIDTSNACISAVKALLQKKGVQMTADDKVEMIAHIKPGMPILGFVQLDLIVYQGSSRFDIGLDYVE
jgi:hypothetical protein